MKFADRFTRNRALAPLSALLVLALLVPAAPAAEQVDHWDLSEIYADAKTWEAERDKLAAKSAVLSGYKGRLATDGATLREALEAYFALDMLASRLRGYAEMRADEDLRESGPQGMTQELRSALAELEAELAWIDPEILTIPTEQIAEFMQQEQGLDIYTRFIERLEKRRPHVLAPELEELLGASRRIQGVGYTIGSLLRNAEIPWKTITLADGTELRVDPVGYTNGRASLNRADRIATYEAFYGQLEAFKGSIAATLSATVQEHVFNARARNYDSSLEASLHANEVDPAVYHMLVKEINAGLPTLHRYLKLRGKILGIDDLRYHDMYPSLVGEVTTDYSWENSAKLVLEALAPLGKAYVKQFGKVLESGWIDIYPQTGKRSGAYVNDSAYEVHPYMLLNHQDNYLSASTLAHEGGHLMQSWYSQEAQPYPTSNYAIFVAEVASTVNEVLFFKHLVSRASSDEERLALLGNFLEGLRTTVFRQTMFAEFELAIHEAVERGESITGDDLNDLYAEMLRRYHGDAEGIVGIDDLYRVEWAYIPHFHYNFYVYQYATSYMAAIALSEGLEQGSGDSRERYLAFLKAGATKTPVELLKDAGVDMTSAEPMRAALRLMNEVMDQIDEILARQK